MSEMPRGHAEWREILHGVRRKAPRSADSVPNVPQPAIQEAPAYEVQPCHDRSSVRCTGTAS